MEKHRVLYVAVVFQKQEKLRFWLLSIIKWLQTYRVEFVLKVEICSLLLSSIHIGDAISHTVSLFILEFSCNSIIYLSPTTKNEDYSCGLLTET